MNKTRRKETAALEPSGEVETPGVAVIGLGAVGSSLVRSLFRTRYRLLAVVNKTRDVAVELALETDVPIASDEIGDIPIEARLLFICARENAITEIVDDLLETNIDFRRAVVAHVSGRLSSSILSPLAQRGAATMSFHPLGSFPPERADKTFRGLAIGLEGDPLAVAVGSALARDLGAQPVEIPSETKEVYHLAAALTSNYLVTLLSDVQRVLNAVDLPPRLTHSLAADTLLNLGSMDPELALTGPIVRGDAEGLSVQVATLERVAPELMARFIALADGTIELALRGERITADESAKLRRILAKAR